jgi:hypothetical protein
MPVLRAIRSDAEVEADRGDAQSALATATRQHLPLSASEALKPARTPSCHGSVAPDAQKQEQAEPCSHAWRVDEAEESRTCNAEGNDPEPTRKDPEDGVQSIHPIVCVQVDRET